MSYLMMILHRIIFPTESHRIIFQIAIAIKLLKF